jgi:hypothetical protein
MTSRTSTTEPGHPWVSSNGVAPGSGERTWMKCTLAPSIVVVNWSNPFSRSSCAPVVLNTPVLGEVLEVVARDAVVPADLRQLVRPAGVREPGGQVVEIALGDGDAEGWRTVGPNVE